MIYIPHQEHHSTLQAETQTVWNVAREDESHFMFMGEIAITFLWEKLQIMSQHSGLNRLRKHMANHKTIISIQANKTQNKIFGQAF